MSRSLLSLLLVLTSACVRLAGEPDAWECESHSDCPDDMRCLVMSSYFAEKQCTNEAYCIADADCPDGNICHERKCWVPESPECTETDDTACGAYTCDAYEQSCNTSCSTYDGSGCQSGYYCDDVGSCQPNCTSDEACGSQMVCEDGRCLGRVCVSDDACGGFACRDDRCLVSCDETDCQDNLLCDLDDHTCKTCEDACHPFACDDDGYSQSCRTVCGSDSDCVAGFDCERRTGQCVAPDGCVDSECGAYNCSGSQCATSCFDAIDCAPGHDCNISTGQCEVACNDTTCAPYACGESETCRVSCTGDEHCAAGNRCDTLTGLCEKPNAFGCFDADCAPYVCGDYSCQPYCSDDQDCHASYRCTVDYGSCE